MKNRVWCVCESPLFVVCSFLLRLLTYFWLDQHFHFTLLLFLDWLLLFRTCTCSNHVDFAASGRARRARILSQFSDWRVRGQQLQLTLLSLLLYLLMTDRLSYDPLPPSPSFSLWYEFDLPSQFVYGIFMKICCTKFCLLFSIKLWVQNCCQMHFPFSIIKVINGLEYFWEKRK